MPFEKPILLLAALIMGQFPAVRRWIKDHWSRVPATWRKPCQKDACHPGAKTAHSVAASADLAARPSCRVSRRIVKNSGATMPYKVDNSNHAYRIDHRSKKGPVTPGAV